MKARLFSAMLLTAALITPVIAQDHDDHTRDSDQHQKYYDRDRRDYHEWNDNENQSYHHFLEERHVKDHDWKKANRREQQDYWKWRHEHPDTDKH